MQRTPGESVAGELMSLFDDFQFGGTEGVREHYFTPNAQCADCLSLLLWRDKSPVIYLAMQ